MKKILPLLLALGMLLCVSAALADAADTVIYGNIYTSDAAQPWAEALAVKNGVFIYVGNAEGAETLIGESTEVITVKPGMITPSLLDAHSHPGIVGTTNWHSRIGLPDTKEELLGIVKDYLAAHPVEEMPFVYFEYYPSNMFGTEGPTMADLDELNAAASDRPVLVRDFSDHASWVNTKAMEMMGIYEDADNAEEAGFWRTADGEFTGWILEFGFNYYEDNMWEVLNWHPADAVTQETISIVTDDMKSWGVTGIMDAYMLCEDHIKNVYDMDVEGKLNMYYEQSVVLDSFEDLEDVIATIKYCNGQYSTDHVTVDTVKIFYDGTNELGDAAIIDGTIGDPDNHGFMLLDREQTKETIRRCNEEGIDVHFHLVGDLAFRTVCDVTEELINEQGPLSIQVEMCHCEFVDAADMVRPAQLGIIINWTPHWSGGYFGDGALQYLGEERYNSMYQFNTMIESGAIVTFGSDIYSMNEENRGNPYFGMQTAMTRVDIEYPLDTEGNMRPSEDAKLALDDLLRGYTINAAIQMRIDDKTGSITVGKRANYNIYDVNLFDIPEDDFMSILPKTVVFEGNVIAEN